MPCDIKQKAEDTFDKTEKGQQYKQGTVEYEEAKAEYIQNFTGRLERNAEGLLQRKYTAPTADTSLVNDPLTAAMRTSNKFTASLIHTAVLPEVYRVGSPLVEQVDKWAEINLPLYTTTKDVISDAWESNEIIQSIRTYVNPSGTGIYENLNKLMSIYKIAKEDSIKRMDETIKQINNELEDAYTEEEIEKLDSVIAHSGIHGLEYEGYLSKLVKKEATLDSLISELEAKIKNPTLLTQADMLSDVYLGRKKTSTDLIGNNNATYGIVLGTRLALDALTSLYALKKTGNSDMLIDMYERHNALYNKIVSMSIDSRHLADKILTYNNDVMKSRGNLTIDIQSTPYQIEAVDKAALESYKYSVDSAKWVVLRQPTDTEIGLVYRESDSRMQEGIGTNVSYIKNGIPLNSVTEPLKYSMTDPTFMVNGSTPTIYLTEEEKKTLGYIKNPVKSIGKAWAHYYLILESQAIRDELLTNMTKTYKSSDNIDDINAEIEKDIKDNKHPVYLNTRGVDGKLSPEVLKKYRKVDTTIMSDVGDFKNKVEYVRKDVAFMTDGYSEGGIFKNHQANLYLNNLKDVIAWLKTNLIVINAPKIALDLASGMGVAISQGASIQEVTRYSKEAMKYSNEMVILRNKRIELQTMYSLETDPVRKKNIHKLVDSNEKEISSHPFSGALANGFINSLSTEMLVKERESFAGLDVKIKHILDKVTKEKSGEFTKFNEAVKRFARAGVGIDTIYLWIGAKLEDGTYKGVSSILKDVASDMERAKSKEDMTDYLSQLALSPNSHFVRLGSAATLYADLLPRWVLYKTYINQGLKENEAATKALEMSLDYKVNLPPSLKFMSDLYLMPFPSFFIRIQRVLLQMAEKTPVSFAGNLALTELTGSGAWTVLGSNIFSKWEKDSIFTNTFDLVNPGNFVPFSNLLYF